jgi:hypothetical protein
MDGDDLSSGPASPAVLDDPGAPVTPEADTPEGETWAPYDDEAFSGEEIIPWWWPMTTYPGDEIARAWVRKVFSFVVVAGCCGFVFWICQPTLIFRNTLPTGGDMGAHVWGPAYLRDQLLPHLRLSGWTPDWLGGFPAYTFYMVLPSLAIVIVNVGLLPTWAAPLMVILFGGLGFLAHRRLSGRVVRGLTFTGLSLAFLLSFHVPYDVSFKMVAVLGLILFPAAVWYLGKGLALRAPMPELMAIACLPFLIDNSLFSIFGGNIASTMAGEFCFSLSLTAGVFFLGVAARGMVSGKHRVLGAVLLAVTMLCHVIPFLYVCAGTLVLLALRIPWIQGLKRRFGTAEPDEAAAGAVAVDPAGGLPPWLLDDEPTALDEADALLATAVDARTLDARTVDGADGDVAPGGAADPSAESSLGLKARFKRQWARLPASVRWVVPVGGVGGLVACFWYIPFYGLSAYLDDMGWSKYGLVTDAKGVKHASLTQFLGYLLPFGPHKTTLQGQTSTADPNMLHGHFFFALALVGVVLSLVMMVRAGIFFTLFGLVAAAAFVLMPQNRFWNARILPLYYLCIYMLAAIGVWLLIRLVPRLLDSDWGHPPRWAGALMVGGAAVLGFWLLRTNHQWNVWTQVLAYFCVFSLAAVGVFLAGRQVADLSWGHPLAWVGLGFIGLTIILGYRLWPHAQSWSSPKQLAFYLLEFALATIGVALVVRKVAPGPSRQPAHWVGMTTVAIVAVGMMGVMLLSIRYLPGASVSTDPKGVTTYHWGPFNTTYQGPVRDWVAWNFTGYEGKGAAWTELDGIKNTMANIGQQDGCGRAFWEYSPDLNRFGSPMALMLLPYWTHSCIGSMEGLYMESSSTTPFHFTIQGELSASPSDAQLWDIFGVDPATVYKGVQFDLGIQHLQMLGVRYFMASSATVKADAAKDPRLKKLATTGAFDVYEVRGAPLVQGLSALPAVWTNVGNAIHSWAKPAEEWFINPSEWGVYRAESGPANWPRIKDGQTPKTVPVKPAKVTNISATRDTISFDVDRVGVPVLVKSSYFPDWQTADGAGPYRVAPNLMVVIPTSKHVVLTYGRSKIELVAWALTFLGLGLLLWMLRTGDPEESDGPGEFEGDRDEDRPAREIDDALVDEPDPEFEFDEDPVGPESEPANEPAEPGQVPVPEPVGAGATGGAGSTRPGDVPSG